MKTNVFLDFDGVLCDSALECFISSFMAYYAYYLSFQPDSLPRGTYSEFMEMRSCVRRGADYLLLQKMIADRITCHSQEDFDRILADQKPGLMDLFHELFYRVRNAFLENERDYWLSLNRIYPQLAVHAKNWAESPAVFILSTKEASFIAEILRYNHVDWPEERIICSGKRSKGTVIAEIMESAGAEKGFLVEDQLDHILAVEDTRIDCALASWGYIKNEWLDRKDITVYGFNDLIKKMLILEK